MQAVRACEALPRPCQLGRHVRRCSAAAAQAPAAARLPAPRQPWACSTHPEPGRPPLQATGCYSGHRRARHPVAPVPGRPFTGPSPGVQQHNVVLNPTPCLLPTTEDRTLPGTPSCGTLARSTPCRTFPRLSSCGPWVDPVSENGARVLLRGQGEIGRPAQLELRPNSSRVWLMGSQQHGVS